MANVHNFIEVWGQKKREKNALLEKKKQVVKQKSSVMYAICIRFAGVLNVKIASVDKRIAICVIW